MPHFRLPDTKAYQHFSENLTENFSEVFCSYRISTPDVIRNVFDFFASKTFNVIPKQIVHYGFRQTTSCFINSAKYPPRFRITFGSICSRVFLKSIETLNKYKNVFVLYAYQPHSSAAIQINAENGKQRDERTGLDFTGVFLFCSFYSLIRLGRNVVNRIFTNKPSPRLFWFFPNSLVLWNLKKNN